MKRPPFSTFPLSVRLGITLTIAGWCFLILSQAVITSTLALPPVTLALVCGVMIYSLKPFARVVCGAFNVLMAAAGVYALYRLSAEQPSGAWVSLPAVMRAVQVILFSAAAYYVLQKRTADFYRRQV